ncbi:MAG: hypothetical protein ACW985_09775 [Candidatus Thorarchaeota archaeon]
MRLREVARVPVSANAYSLYVRQQKDARAQVFSLDYGERLRIYDTTGSLKTSRGYSSKVRCIAVADVESSGEDALIGGAGKRVLVVDQKGRVLWKNDLESSVIACDARDVDGDDAAEVVAALQNKRVILWNHEQTALFSRTVDQAISDVWLEDITNDSELEVVIAQRKGTVLILSAAGYELKRLELGNTITVFGVLAFGKRRLFVTGNHSPQLQIWDIDGNAVSSIMLPAPPKALATGIPDDVSDIAYLVVSTRDRKLIFWEAQDTVKVKRSEKATLQEIESTKMTLYRRSIKCGNCGAPTSPEAMECTSCGAKLEMLDEYAIEEYMQDSIESITSKHSRIQLKELDRILRKTLPRPAAYNLRRSIQTMIKKGLIDGHFDGDVFVRTVEKKPKRKVAPSKAATNAAVKLAKNLLDKQDSFDIELVEKETGVPRQILRRTLIILLGEGLIEGILMGNVFSLAKEQSIGKFLNIFQKELEA